MPEATLKALADHGQLSSILPVDGGDCEEVLAKFVQAGIDVDLKSGQDYYIRVEIAAGVMKGHGRLILVAPEQGAYEIKNLKPLDRDKVKTLSMWSRQLRQDSSLFL